MTGNVAAGKTLARSAHFWDAVGAAKLELVERLHADLAVDSGDGTETLVGLIDAYSEVRSYMARIVQSIEEIRLRQRAQAPESRSLIYVFEVGDRIRKNVHCSHN